MAEKTTVAMFEKALARAKADGVSILGAIVQIDGTQGWAVKGKNNIYVVAPDADGVHLQCSCPARLPCKHRAIVAQYLLEVKGERSQEEWLQALYDFSPKGE